MPVKKGERENLAECNSMIRGKKYGKYGQKI
jgi:hypothetical protein